MHRSAGNKTPGNGVVPLCLRAAYAFAKALTGDCLDATRNFVGAARKPARRGSVTQAGGKTSFMGIADPNARRLERRWAPRYSFRAGLEIEWGSALLRANTRDVSASGMFIESSDPLWIGAGFSAYLQLERPVRVDCRVRRIEPGQGMGVSVSIGQEQQQTYQELLQRLSQSGPSLPAPEAGAEPLG